MKTFKKLDKTTKVGLSIAIVFILPLLISITVKVLSTQNIII